MWDRVAEVNAKNSVKTQSGDFAGNYVEKEAVERLEPFIKALNKQVAGSANVIGVAVAIDGKMDTVDVFESTPLFRLLAKTIEELCVRRGERGRGRSRAETKPEIGQEARRGL